MTEPCQFQPDPLVVSKMYAEKRAEVENWAYCKCGRGKIVTYKLHFSLDSPEKGTKHGIGEVRIEFVQDPTNTCEE